MKRCATRSWIRLPRTCAPARRVAATDDGAAQTQATGTGRRSLNLNRLSEAVDELITIARDGGVRAEIYHLKAAGQSNWPKMDRVLAKVCSAAVNRIEAYRIELEVNSRVGDSLFVTVHNPTSN